jgi:hypothetical protein
MLSDIKSLLSHIVLLLNRVAGASVTLIALACVAWVIVSLSHVDWSTAGFRALIATIFSALAWLYLQGPLSRIETGFLRQFAGLVLAAPVLFVSVIFIWQERREDRLRSYCESVHMGMRVTEMSQLQERYGIDESFLIHYNRNELHQTITSRDVELIGGNPGDPDFECSFRHNGEVVTSAEIVP